MRHNIQTINGKLYIIHRSINISNFKGKDGTLQVEWIKAWKDNMPLVNHVMKTDTHVLFAETIDEAEIIEEPAAV